MDYGFVFPMIARDSLEGSSTADAVVPVEVRLMDYRG